MDSLFLLEQGARASFLQHIMQSFRCTYICLWQYLPQPSNFFLFMDGLYHEDNNQASSSSGNTLARRLFEGYRQTVIPVENNRVPGFAFKSSFPYLELKDSDLLRLSSIQAQLHFYQEAKIKTAIFMGCMFGEIELGFSNDTQANMKMEIMSLFSEDLSQAAAPVGEFSFPVDNRPSSSSSSLRSLSFESSEHSPLLFTINPTTSHTINPLEPPMEAPFEQPLRPSFTTTTTIPLLLQPREVPIEQPLSSSSITTSTTSTNIPLHQAILSSSQIRNIQFPTIESENAAMTQAILRVLSSSPSSSSHQPEEVSQKGSAFKHYRSALAPSSSQLSTRVRRHNPLKRAITFFRSLNSMRTQQHVRPSNPTSSQLHHMISERRRREKINESFQTLRSLLPPGSKKDKVSVLTSTMEYMSSLKAQVAELNQRNQLLEAQILPPRGVEIRETTTNERVNVRISNVGESTSEARMVDLQVIVRGEYSLLDLAVRVLEFLRRVSNVSLMFVEADTQMVEPATVNQATFRLRIENIGEWDESGFLEAVKRVVGTVTCQSI